MSRAGSAREEAGATIFLLSDQSPRTGTPRPQVPGGHHT